MRAHGRTGPEATAQRRLTLLFCPAAHKLPPLTVAILSMLGLIAFMLLVCLLSCLFNIHKRKEKSKKLMVLAQQAGKGEGDAFRQVTRAFAFAAVRKKKKKGIVDRGNV